MPFNLIKDSLLGKVSELQSIVRYPAPTTPKCPFAVGLRKKLRGRHEHKTGVLICEGSSKQTPCLTHVLVLPWL